MVARPNLRQPNCVFSVADYPFFDCYIVLFIDTAAVLEYFNTETE